uniref:DUF6709 family protein n=1 Tax=Agathobacter sp. TaxID=2021311 RepID=UPI004055E450
MTENFEHYISRNISTFYKRRLPVPIIFLIFLIALWFIFPLGNILSPETVHKNDNLETLYKNGHQYISTEFTNLTFTGYTTKRFGSTDGYFYYGIKDEDIFIVLLSPNTCEEGLPSIESITATCRIVKGKSSYDVLLEKLAYDLNWTKEGITSQLPKCYFSEPDFNPMVNTLMFLTYFGSLLYTIVSLVRYVTFIYMPVFAPACQNLVIYGNPKSMLEEAEEELATLPQLATEDMFITEHYFILTSPYGNAIVPIQEIVWIYKYSTLHKFLSYHFSISYTLHINGNKHLFIQCPKNTKSDIDGIIDYLSEANHDILVGFSEENRLKAQEKLPNPFQLEKFAALLKKKL